jgi:small-conductance mechanosensitive channel
VIGKPIMTSLVLAALLLAGAAALKYAQHAGMIDADIATRATHTMFGLLLAYYGNVIPKRLCASRSIAADARKQSVLRVSGWSFMLAGLAYAAFSALAPQALASAGAIAAVALALAITLVYALWSATTCPKGVDASGEHSV